MAIRAAAWLGDSGAIEDAIHALDGHPGRVPAATRREGEASVAALRGDRNEARAAFADATRRWRELGLEFEAATCALSFARLLGASEPDARAAAEEADALFERLGARPLQERLAEAIRARPHTAADRKDARVAEPSTPATSD
jgi:hypothetical protein